VSWRAGLAAAWVAALLQPMQALAVLGGDVSATRRTAQAADARQSLALRYRTFETVAPDGSSIREYARPDGIVFAVAWSTRIKPDLPTLLGQHFQPFAQAARQKAAPGMSRQIAVQQGDLVVHSAGHLNAFAGRAYVRSLVPEGVDVDALR
jgi:hypothetical protein